jgi:hypothetical protein
LYMAGEYDYHHWSYKQLWTGGIFCNVRKHLNNEKSI